MKTPYDDIIHLPHHVSPTRKRMSMIDRAAQFSPFAALTGYDTAIRETGRLTDTGFELAQDGTDMLNEKIRQLQEHIAEAPEVSIHYFLPDERKCGGSYAEIKGTVRRIDGHRQTLTMENGTEIPFRRIYDIDGDFL